MSEKVQTTKRSRGRPKGALNSRNAAVKDRALARSSVSPLDVMMQTMERRWNDAQKALDPEERGKLEQEACAVAEKVAPYLHARLQATTIKGDADAPLFSISLPASDALRAMVRGIEDKG